ncbi:hypothetical protein [Paraburkholderia sediminicola]|uniref:hypothetical protein n=1 Tax=Paraburkholderia sediminicola TaxID=458836 RepID=UPI0038BBEE0D
MDVIPIYGRERFYEIKKHCDVGDPLPFAGAHYVIVALEYDMRTETGSFSVQQIRLVGEPKVDTSVRDAVLSNL